MSMRPGRSGAAGLTAAVDMAAVFASRLGGVAVSLLFIPIYTRLLSPAEFGVVALLLSLQSFFLVSDLGLATLLARDTAIARGDLDALRAVADDRRRAEVIMLGAITVAALVAVPILSTVDGGAPGQALLRVAVAAMLIALLVLLNISQLCLNALGHYRLTSILTTGGTIARAGASALALAFVEASVDMFLLSQVAVAALHYALVRVALNRRSGSPRPRSGVLLDRVSMGTLLRRCRAIMVYTLGGAAALNLDKTILAALLPIETTGVYFLATTYALVPIALLSGPLNQYFAPRVAQAEAAEDQAGRWRLAIVFQLLLTTAVVLPAFILVRHAPLLVSFWLPGNPAAPQIAWLASILLVGTAVGATGYYPTTYLIAVADNGFLARLSSLSATVVLATAAGLAWAGSLTGVAVAYAVFHMAGCLIQWWRLRTHWGAGSHARFVIGCYLLPLAALLAICVLIWIAMSVAATGLPALIAEAALQLVLGGAAMVIAARWCYRHAASLHHPRLRNE